MNTELYQEIEQMIVSARGMSKAEFDQIAEKFLADHSEKDREEIGEALAAFHVDRIQQYIKVTEEIIMLKQLDGVEKYINMAEISRSYFGRSKSWLYQRMHGHAVRGKRVSFTREEKKKLSEALLDLSEHIKSVALKIS